jgi:hypothetical protein
MLLCVDMVAIMTEEEIMVVLSMVLEGAVKVHLSPLEGQSQRANYARRPGTRSYSTGTVLIVTSPVKRRR